REHLPERLPRWPERESGVHLVLGPRADVVARPLRAHAHSRTGDVPGWHRHMEPRAMSSLQRSVAVVLVAAVVSVAAMYVGAWWMPFLAGLAIGVFGPRARF